MLNLAAEKDAETLRQAALILERENQRLIEKNLELQRQVMRLTNATPDQLQQRIAKLEQELQAAVRHIVGGNSEKQTRPDTEPTQPARSTAQDATEAQPPRRGHGPREQKQLPRVEQRHELDEADRQNCPTCGGELHEMKGQFEESEEITVVERRFVVVQHQRQKYACDCHASVETALGPDKLIPGGRYSTDFAIEIAAQKYLDHLPLERQARIMGREGLTVDAQTLWDQLNALAKRLEPALERLHDHALSQPVIGVDETHWKYLGKNGGEHGRKRWQVWAVTCATAVVYRMLPFRDTNAAKSLLKAYRGVVTADGYGVYEHLVAELSIVLANCWAHARRKFIDLGDALTEELRGEILALIGKLYELERSVPPGEEGLELRRKLRDEKSREVVREIQKWCLEQKARVLPRSALAGAIDYLFNRWTGLTRFLDNPAIPLDNNWSERSLRGPVVGRKNHYGSKSERGTQVAALFYSLLESAKLVGLEPKAYLRLAVAAALRDEQIPLPHEVAAQS